METKQEIQERKIRMEIGRKRRENLSELNSKISKYGKKVVFDSFYNKLEVVSGLKCPKCKKVFQTQQEMIKHLVDMHDYSSQNAVDTARKLSN